MVGKIVPAIRVVIEKSHSVLLVIYLEQQNRIPRALYDVFSIHNRGGFEKTTDPTFYMDIVGSCMLT
jgi:hypothetical protein